MVDITLIDRLGTDSTIEASPGETIETALLKNHVPPKSVITTADDRVISESHEIRPGHSYRARVIEGYHISQIRELYEFPDEERTPAYLKRRLLLAENGDLKRDDAALTLDGVEEHVERTVAETIREYDLLQDGDRVLLGFSGGVDSSGLLLSLDAAQERLDRDFEIVAVTFEEVESDGSPTVDHADLLSDDIGIEHHFADARLTRDVFNLNESLDEIFPELMHSDFSDFVMYMEHHAMRRTLEAYARSEGIQYITLGLHTTDLLAGLLNFQVNGQVMDTIGRRDIGDFTYVYPLMYVLKKELQLYHYSKTGAYARHSAPNIWEVNPLDRNFYYYVADIIQSYWPGIEYWMFEGHDARVELRRHEIEYVECGNCGGAILQQQTGVDDSDLCRACAIYSEMGYVS